MSSEPPDRPTRPGRRRIRRRFLYATIPALLLALGGWVWHLVFRTNLSQLVYMDSVRNLSFDCLQLVDEPYVYKARPGGCRLDNLEYHTTLRSDRNGFRNPDTQAEADIALIGDSHTQGFGVEDDQTFAAVLQSRYGFRTRNLGIASYATWRELEALKAYSRGERIVVIQYCDNDLRENQLALKLTPEEFRRQVKERWTAIVANYGQGKARGWSVPLLDLGRRLLHGRYQSIQASQSLQRRNITIEAEAFARILSAFEALLRDKRIIVFESSGHGLNHPSFKDAFAAAIARFAPTLKVSVLDSASFLEASDYYFLDDHLNPAGHAHVADRVNAALVGATP